MNRTPQIILVTGGAGFIGSNFIRYLFSRKDFSGKVINIDKLTYAGNLMSLHDVSSEHEGVRYYFERVDICDVMALTRTFADYNPDTVVHFAAETHVDRSILGPSDFINTNILGTSNLLEAAKNHWKGRTGVRFHHVSTDEVYGSLGDDGYFFETTPYDPRSPYSASKAGSDHLVRAYYHTYSLPVTISNCSNNYGPYQFPEKLIPLMILNMLEGRPLPVYGDGRNVRDWLFVTDHASAIWKILQMGSAGETYNIGGENEWENIRLVETLCDIVANETAMDRFRLRGLITFVEDRPGHDRRYAINCDKAKRDVKWRPTTSFEEGLASTVAWYCKNSEWATSVKSGEYRKWLGRNYANR